MGQQNGKDTGGRGGAANNGGAAAQRGRIPAGNARTGTQGMRSQTVNDALVAPRGGAATQHGDHAHQQQDDGRAESGSATQSPNRPNPAGGSPVTATTTAAIPAAPVVIRYKNTDVKQLIERKTPIEILIQEDASQSGEASSKTWRRLPMSRSDDNYFVIVNLPPGEHRFRFSLPDRGGGTLVDPTQPTVQDNAGTSGGASEPANVIQVSADIMTTKDDDELIDDGTGWGHIETQFEETRKYPPILPPHLRYTPLNTPPTQIRCQVDGSLNVATSTLEAEHLPLPLSVTINHVYFQKREDHVVSGITTRYCNKFTTIAYYRSIADANGNLNGDSDFDGNSSTTAPVAVQ
jgi:hypothetical protein